MVISKYTEDFVRLCVEKFFKEQNPDFAAVAKKAKLGIDLLCEEENLLIDMFERTEEEIIKILFRIEHCEDIEDVPLIHAIANIIDKTIGSNYCKKRPSDDQIHAIVNNHSVEE